MNMIKRKKSILTRKILGMVFYAAIVSFIIVVAIIFAYFFPMLKNNSLHRAEITTEQLRTNFSALQADMAEKADSIAYSLDFSKLLSDFFLNPTVDQREKISLYINSFTAGHSDVFYIVLESNGYERIQSNLRNYRIDLGVLESDPYNNLLASDFGSYYSPIYMVAESTVDSAKKTNDRFYHIGSFSKNYYIGYKRTTMTVFFNLSQDIRQANAISSLNLDSFYIYTYKNDLIYTPEENDSLVPDIELLEQLQRNGAYQSRDGTYFLQYLDGYLWTVISFVSNKTLNNSFINIIVLLMVFMLLISVTTIIIIAPYISRRMSPLKDLSNTMANYSPEGGSDSFSTIRTDDEINDMSETFNRMVLKNNDHIRQIYEKERTAQQMKYSLLMSQMDPHFIYNTMNIITALARQQNHEAVISVNQALQRILQDRLKISDIKVFDSIAHEIEIVKQYQIIMQYRYGKNVQTKYCIDNNLENVLIPKNIIQPLVENAYYHGLTDDDGVISGTINIRIYNENNEIIIEVADNGSGIDTQKLELLQKYNYYPDKSFGNHIGLENIYRRLKYLCGEKSKIEFKSEQGAGTRVRLVIPQTPQNQGEYDA